MYLTTEQRVGYCGSSMVAAAKEQKLDKELEREAWKARVYVCV